MAINQDDTYRAECRYGISAEGIRVLTLLYQPLIGCDGTALYMTLASESGSLNGSEKIRKLLHLSGLHSDEFERTLARLEEFSLLKTWNRSTGMTNSYIFELNRVPAAQEVIASRGFMGRYLAAMGKEETEAALARFGAVMLAKTGYTEVTRPVVNTGSDIDRSVVFNEVYENPAMIRGDSVWPHFSEFISRTSTLIFPAEARTPENLNLICHLAAVNGISVDVMRDLTGRCMDMNTMILNTERLKLLASRAKVETVQSDDPYTLPPAMFLQMKQEGRPVTGADRSILQYLAADMHFGSEVINVMIEYILSVSSNRLNRKFVESVAGEWARDSVKTREQAITQTKKSLEKAIRNKVNVVATPAYYRKQKEGALPEEKKASSDKLARVREMQKKMGEQS